MFVRRDSSLRANADTAAFIKKKAIIGGIIFIIGILIVL